MESIYHHNRSRRARKSQQRKQIRNALRSKHSKRWNGSWKKKMNTNYRQFYYSKHLKPTLVKLHKRGYNLHGYPDDNEMQDVENGYLNGSRHLNTLYVKNDVEKMFIMGFLLTFLFHKHVHVVHLWNTDLLTQMAAVICLLPLARLVLSHCLISERLMQTMGNVLMQSLMVQPAACVLRLGLTTSKTPMTCRQQFVQGYKPENLKFRLQQWFSNLLATKNECSQKLTVRIPQSKINERKSKKSRSYITLQKQRHLRFNKCAGKHKRQEHIFKHHFRPQFANITTLPTNNDLSGFCKELESHQCQNEMELLKYEWKRLITFKDCKQHINGVGLARNGFYFAGNRDNPSLTRCYSCGLENSSWEYFSDVEDFHRRHSPNCRHILTSMNETSPSDGSQSSASIFTSRDLARAGAAGAIPKTLTQNASLKKSSKINSSTQINLQDSPQSSASDAKTIHSRAGQCVDQVTTMITLPIASPRIQDVCNSPPMTYPDYHSGEARKQSFHVNAWPYQIDPSPKAMAEAGFFYTGDADKVTCFYCGVCCGDWNNGENAWMEHAVANINCPFLEQLKDCTFFDGARREIAWRQNERSRPKSGSIITVPVQDVDPMATHTARVLADMCANPMHIAQAVQYVWRTKGFLTNDPTMAMNWILDERFKEEELPSNSGNINSLTVVVTSATLTTSASSSQVQCIQANTVVTVTASLATSNNTTTRATSVINQATSVINQATPVVDQATSVIDQSTPVINTATPSGEDETLLKELQQTTVSRSPPGDVERMTVVGLTSQNHTISGPIYSMAGQQANRDHEIKLAKVAKRLVKMGFTLADVTKELNWMQHMEGSSVDAIVQMAVICITGKQTQTSTSEADLLESTCVQALTISTPVSQTDSATVSTDQAQCVATELQLTDRNDAQPACSVVEGPTMLASDMLPSESGNVLTEKDQGINTPQEPVIKITETILCGNSMAVQVAAGGDLLPSVDDTPAQMTVDQMMLDQHALITKQDLDTRDKVVLAGETGNVENVVEEAAGGEVVPKDEVMGRQDNADNETNTNTQRTLMLGSSSSTGTTLTQPASESTVLQCNSTTANEGATGMAGIEGTEGTSTMEATTIMGGAIGGPTDTIPSQPSTLGQPSANSPPTPFSQAPISGLATTSQSSTAGQDTTYTFSQPSSDSSASSSQPSSTESTSTQSQATISNPTSTSAQLVTSGQPSAPSQPVTVSEDSAASQLALSGAPIASSLNETRALQASGGRQLETPGHIQTHLELILLDSPKHPEYGSVDARANTFRGTWPSSLDQTPCRMAETGFYYTAVADFTRCYACGGGLKNWEAGDDPVIEHTRWYPTCPYVTKLKGEKYVQAVIVKQQQHLEEKGKQQVALSQQRAAERTPLDPLRSTAAAVLSEMGYSQDRIKDAILAVRQQTGNTEVTAEQALIWILDDDERRTAIAARRAADSSAFFSSSQASSTSATSSSTSAPATTSSSSSSSSQSSTGTQQPAETGIKQPSTSTAGNQQSTETGIKQSASAGSQPPTASGSQQRGGAGSQGSGEAVSQPSSGSGGERSSLEAAGNQQGATGGAEVDAKRADLLESTRVQALTISTPVSQTDPATVSTDQVESLAIELQLTDRNDAPPACSVVEGPTMLASNTLHSESVNALTENHQGLNTPQEPVVTKPEAILCGNAMAVAAGGDLHSSGDDSPDQMTVDQMMSDQHALFIKQDLATNDQVLLCDQFIPDEQGMTHEQVVLARNAENVIAVVEEAVGGKVVPKDEVIGSQKNVDDEKHTNTRHTVLQSSSTGSTSAHPASESTVLQSCSTGSTSAHPASESTVLQGNSSAADEGATAITGIDGTSTMEATAIMEGATGGPTDSNREQLDVATKKKSKKARRRDKKRMEALVNLQPGPNQATPADQQERKTPAAAFSAEDSKAIGNREQLDVETKKKSKKARRREKKRMEALVNLQPGLNQATPADQQERKTTATAYSAEDSKTIGEMMMCVQGLTKTMQGVKKSVVEAKEENEQLKERTICKICMDRDVTVTFRPCGHLVTCDECSRKVDICPICRMQIKKRENTYIP